MLDQIFLVNFLVTAQEINAAEDEITERADVEEKRSVREESTEERSEVVDDITDFALEGEADEVGIKVGIISSISKVLEENRWRIGDEQGEILLICKSLIEDIKTLLIHLILENVNTFLLGVSMR